MTAVKKYFPTSEHAKELIDEQLPHLRDHAAGNYFVEVQDKLVTNVTYKYGDERDIINDSLLQVNPDSAMKIGLVYMGRQAPGVNNVVDGLLRYQAQRQSKIELLGFVNGIGGLLSADYEIMTRETFKNYVNLGGMDYIGNGFNELRTPA